MALRFCDSFDHATTTDWVLKYTTSNIQSSGILAANGRNSTASLRMNSGNHGILKAFDSQATWICGFAMKFTTSVTDTIILITLKDGATNHVDVRVNASARLTMTRNGTVLGTGTTTLSAGTWYYVEAKFTIHDTTGVAVLKVNGVTDINLSSQDTRNAGNSTADTLVIFNGPSIGTTLDFDDLYLCDATGSVNNDFLGDVRVQAILPSGAGTTTQWTPSAGSNFQNVDDTAPNGDTDYNSNGTATQKDTYAFGDLTPTAGTIAGLQWNGYLRKDDSGAKSIAPVYRSTSDFDGGTIALGGTTYTYVSEIKETNPNTSTAWTIAEVNAAEFGIKVIV